MAGWLWIGTCFDVYEVPVFDGDGMGDAKRAIDACLDIDSAEGDPVRTGESDIGTGLGLMVEGPSPLSDILTSWKGLIREIQL